MASRRSSYAEASRRLSTSYVFVAPLFALYQFGLLFDPAARNGTDPIFQRLFARFRVFGPLVVDLALLGLLLLAIWRTRAQRLRTPGLYGRMLGESAGWAALLLAFAALTTPALLKVSPLMHDLIAGIGAGVYEEVLFRFLVLGGLILLLGGALGGRPVGVVPFAIVVSALLFSAAHHTIGGEAWRLPVFLFRALMGVLLGWIYWARGLGIVVYTHALYNAAVAWLRLQ